MPSELASIDFVFRNKGHPVGKPRLIVTGFQVKAAGFGLQVADCPVGYPIQLLFPNGAAIREKLLPSSTERLN